MKVNVNGIAGGDHEGKGGVLTKFTNIDKNNLILSNTSGKGFYFLN